MNTKPAETNTLMVADQKLPVLSEETMKMYSDYAGVGAEAVLKESIPYLKIHTATSTKNELAAGGEPIVGSIFYTGTHEQFKEVEAHIVHISRGFYTERKDANGAVDPQHPTNYNHIVGGMMTEGLQPFLMYITGMKLNPFWQFRDAIKPLLKHRTYPIPLFALTVKISTQTMPNQRGGKTWVYTWDLARDEENKLALESDKDMLKTLRDGVDSVGETVEEIIRTTEVTKEGRQITVRPAQVVNKDEAQVVDVNDIPF